MTSPNVVGAGLVPALCCTGCDAVSSGFPGSTTRPTRRAPTRGAPTSNMAWMWFGITTNASTSTCGNRLGSASRARRRTNPPPGSHGPRRNPAAVHSGIPPAKGRRPASASSLRLSCPATPSEGPKNRGTTSPSLARLRSGAGLAFGLACFLLRQGYGGQAARCPPLPEACPERPEGVEGPRKTLSRERGQKCSRENYGLQQRAPMLA